VFRVPIGEIFTDFINELGFKHFLSMGQDAGVSARFSRQRELEKMQ